MKMKHLLLAMGWGMWMVSGAAAGPDRFTIYPREYARTVDNDKVVGDGGRLKMVEDADGEQIEVVEYAVPRAKQREGDIQLFTTRQPPDKAAKTLTRTYRGWGNGAVAELTFSEPDVADRAIYRRGSADHDRRIAALFETAQLNAAVGKLLWFVRAADTNLAPRLAPTARRASDYASLRRQLVERDRDILYLQGLQYNLARIPALGKDLEAARKELADLAARQPGMSNELAKLEKELGGRTEPKGDPALRRQMILRMEEYELRADVRYQEKQIDKLTWTVSAIGSNAAAAVSAELAAAGAKDLAAYAAATPDQAGQLRGLIEKRLQSLQADRQALPDVPALLSAAAREIVALMKAMGELKDLSDKGKDLLKVYAQAYADKGPEAEMADALKTWSQAAAAIPAVDFGRYRVTLVSRLQGTPRCVGTPIIVEAGGVRQAFYSYQWPDTEGYHPQTFDVDFGEGPSRSLYLALPRDSRATTVCQSLDHYNQIRLKGWKLNEETTFSRMADGMFADPKQDPAQVAAGYAAEEYHTRGTFDVSVTLCRTRRYQGAGLGSVGAGFQTGGLGGPDASLDVLYLDSVTIENVPEPGLVLRQALVQKNWIKPGQENRFMAWIHNRTDAEQAGRLKTILARGLGETHTINERDVKLAPRSYARVVVPWRFAEDALWYGYEAQMELTCGGQTSRAADVFSLHPNTFPVVCAGGDLGYDVYRGPKFLGNQFELFGITPADSVGVLPADVMAPYACGMSDGARHVVACRAAAQGCHQLGFAFTHYLSPLCTGVDSYPQYLKHPEWWPERLHWTEQANDNWNSGNRLFREQYYGSNGLINEASIASNHPRLHLEQTVNHGHKLLFDNMVEDLITYSYLVPWDGTRWDGGPLSVYSRDFLGRTLKHPRTGEPVDTYDKCKQVGADLFRELKERMWKHHPEWVYANNGDNDGYGGTLITLEKDPPDVKGYPQFIEFMKDNGGYMDEGWMSAYIFTDARNKVESYLKICFKESMIMKQYGGNLWTFSPERDGTPYFNVDYIYYTVLPYLCGSTYIGQISRSPWSEDGPAYFFIRFSEFLLDRSWRPYPQAVDRITVDAPNVWSAELATWRSLGAGRAQVVLPIINRHPRQRLMETQNRYSELPDPIAAAIGVTVKAPEGFAGVTPEAWELTCEPRTAATALKPALAQGAVSVEVPGLKLFKVIVLDFRRPK